MGKRIRLISLAIVVVFLLTGCNSVFKKEKVSLEDIGKVSIEDSLATII